MRPDEFMTLVDAEVARCKRVLLAREKKYTAGGDRLGQFYKAAALTNGNSLTAIAGMMSKHVTKLFDLMEETRSGLVAPSKDWNETIGDLHNYLFLLKGLLEEVGE